MIKSDHRKKIIFFASIAFVALVGVGLIVVHTALAQEPTTPAAAQSGFLNSLYDSLKEAFGTPAMAVIEMILLIIQSVLYYILMLAGDFLKIALGFNFLTPANMSVATYGWGISRDIANSLLILILLWVAFTIIFNLERLGGKEYLVRIVTVGLLINFSLGLVTAVFGFSNVLANVFAQKFPDDTALFIINTTKLQNTLGIPDQKQILAAENASKKNTPPQETPSQIKSEKENISPIASVIKDTAYATLGIRQTQAAGGLATLTTCGIGWAAGVLIGLTGFGAAAWPLLIKACLYVATASAGATLWQNIFSTTFSALFALNVVLAISNIFLFLAAAALFYAALALIIRFVAQILLTIAAPLALLFYAIPSKSLASYSSLWLSNLLKWAFFAPAFYFLFYITLYILQEYDKLAISHSDTQPLLVSTLDVNRTMEILIALILIIVSVRFSKKAAGEFGEVVVKWGKRAGKFAVATAGLRAARRLRGVAATTAERVAKNERLAMATRYIPGAKTIQRGAARLAAGEREATAAAEKQYQRYTADELSRMLSGEFRPTYRAAIMKQLGDKKGIDKLSDEQAETEIMRLKNLGEDVRPLLKQKPSLAKINPALVSLTPGEQSEIESLVKSGIAQKEAARKVAFSSVIKSIKPADIKNLSNKTFDDEEFIKEAWINWSPEHLSALYRDNPRLFDEKMNNQAVIRKAINEMSVESYKRYDKYLVNNPLGQTMGISLPPKPTMPTAAAAARPATLTAAPGRFVGTAASGTNWRTDINIAGGAPYYSAQVKSGYSLPRNIRVTLQGNTVRVEGPVQEPAGTTHNFIIEIKDTGGNTIDVPFALTIT